MVDVVSFSHLISSGIVDPAHSCCSDDIFDDIDGSFNELNNKVGNLVLRKRLYQLQDVANFTLFLVEVMSIHHIMAPIYVDTKHHSPVLCHATLVYCVCLLASCDKVCSYAFKMCQHVMYVGPTCYVCGPNMLCMWVQHVMYVGPTCYVCGPNMLCMWVQHVMYVGPTVS